MLALLAFNLVHIALCICDIKVHDKSITPYAIIAAAYVALVDMDNLVFSKLYPLRMVSASTMWMVSCFLFLAFLIDISWGLLIRHFAKKDVMRQIDRPIAKNDRQISYVIYILFFIGVLSFLGAYLRCLMVYGYHDTKGHMGGILAHIAMLGFILGPVALKRALDTKKRPMAVLIILMSLLELMIAILFGGKYLIFINLTYYLMYFQLLREKKLSLTRMVILFLCIALLAFTVFGLVYLLFPVLLGGESPNLNLVMDRLTYYLFSSLIACDDAFAMPSFGDSTFPFAVPINIYRAITSSAPYVEPLFERVFEAAYAGRMVNVSGLFGEAVYCLGYGLGTIYIGAYFALIGLLGFCYKRFGSMYISYTYMCAITVFMFFSNFMILSGVVYPLALAILVDIGKELISRRPVIG